MAKVSLPGVILFAGAFAAYFARPWSCSATLAAFAPSDNVPYAHFDYHGIGALIAWVLAFGFAAPIMWLAGRIFLRPKLRLGLFRTASEPSVTAWSIVIAVALAVPMHSQLSYLFALPLSSARLVISTSLLWVLIVELARSTLIGSEDCDATISSVGRPAVGLAGLTLLPKLLLLANLISA